MFNEVLTGKTSVEAPFTPIDSDAVATCFRCLKSHPASRGVNGHCPMCAFDLQQANLAESSRALAEIEDRQRRDARNAMIIKIVVAVLIAIGFGIFRFGMRSAYRDDMKQAQGIKSSY